MSKIIPIWNRVIIQVVPAKNETSSWIILPDSKEKPSEWLVIAVWVSEDKNINVKVWDIVLYKKYSPTEVKVEWEEYLILDLEDVMAKIEK